MTLDSYNFKQYPFSATLDLDNLFWSPSHNAALRAIRESVQKRSGIVVITGQEGVGKTTILRAFLHQADTRTLKTIRIQPPTVSYPALLSVVARALGVEAQPDDSEALLAQVHNALKAEYQAGRNIALVIDEAQRMPLDTLTSLSRLLTSEASQAKPLQIVMVGSPEIKKILNQKPLRPLKRHVAVHTTLSPLTKRESIAYIRSHLALATEEPGPIFSFKALKHITAYAKGMPKMLNILCVDALLMGAYYHEQPVSAKTVKKMIADWESPFLTSPFSRWGPRTIGVMAATVIMGLLWWFSFPNLFFTATPAVSTSARAERVTLVGTSTIVAPVPQSIPITGDERQLIQLQQQGSGRQTPDRLAEEEQTSAGGQVQQTPRGENDNAWLYTQHPKHYSVQLVSVDSASAAQRYIERQQLGNQATYFHTRMKGKDWYYVLYGSFATWEEAEAVRQRISTSARTRNFGVLQQKRCGVAAELPPQQSLEITSFCAHMAS